MRFRVGDRVRFLNEKGEGTVSAILNKNTVAVTIEDGFEIPYVISELVPVHEDAAKNSQPKEEEIPVVQHTAYTDRKKEKEGIYLAINPEHERNISTTAFNFWLVNHSSYDIMFICSAAGEGSYQVFERGEMKPYESRIIATVPKKQLDDFANVKVETLFYNLKKYDHRPPVSEIIKVKQARLYKENAFTETPLLEQKCLLLTVSRFGEELFFDNPENRSKDLNEMFYKTRAEQEEKKISKPHTKNNSAYEMEIDLHIEELIDNYKGMSNAEIVVIQLRHFEIALDEAINAHCRRLTVIHGVGNGRLKTEVRNILSAQGLRFHDASYSKYGFGATEVIF